MMKILFCGYRDWSQNVYVNMCGVGVDAKGNTWQRAISQEKALQAIKTQKFDLVLCVGWSWIFPVDVVENNVIIGAHPSDLPDYAGGSPLQHQILDGLTETKCTLFRLSSKLDGGDIIDKEPMSLEGKNMDEVLGDLAEATIKLLRRLIEAYPRFPSEFRARPNNVTKPRKRLKPKQSKLSKSAMARMSAKEIYNIIRARTDPYPNVYIEDKTGRVYFTDVRFEEGEKE